MVTRKALDGQAMGLMVFVCLCLGMQQVALKAAAADVAPVLQISLRSGIAALLVLAYLVWAKRLPTAASGNWRPGLLAGALFGFEYLLLGESLRFTSASHAAVLLYTGPVFAALGLHLLLPEERMSRLQWAGISLAFAGIVLTFTGRDGGQTAAGSQPLLGDLLALASGLAWGLSTVVVRASRLARAPAQEGLFYQLLVAFVLLGVWSLLSGQTALHATPVALVSLGFQALVISFVALMTWFWLLRNYLASQLGALSFLTPVVGVVLGAWWLNEPLELSFMAGAVLVLVGILLVSGHTWLTQQWQSLTVRRQAG
ncbi:DMT family transporter [Thalassolituus sp. LLYu03]|uniref:DMT family transporter n=1 Tax=Thalassolituus sp. LLYu03 TaxID=3421656 RepID=UPI003D2936D3